MNNKKARERKFLNEVAQIYSAFPAGEIADSESPDFLIAQGSETVGVEIVDYIRGQNEGESVDRRNEVLLQRVANTAREIFESSYDAPLLIYFHWNHRYLLRQSEISQLARAVVDLVKSHVPTNLFESIRLGVDELDGTVLDGICHLISITRVRNQKQSLWSFVSAGWIAAQTNEIQQLINSKNGKVLEYRQRCDQIWLIIVADGQYITSSIELPEAVTEHIYASSFEQVLLFDRVSQKVVQIKIQGHSAA